MNVRDRLYYVDQFIIIASSNRLGCPVMHYRNGVPTDKRIKQALRSCQMRLTGDMDEFEGNTYYKLKEESDASKVQNI